ncbi:MAG: hypothetical protein A3K04_06755 [Gallionellales bacterium RBG_16_56_9]|nr:MAG: hypothetical protein A3K04_06755 [Gallionellales bacterium RBG_16_56_9]
MRAFLLVRRRESPPPGDSARGATASENRRSAIWVESVVAPLNLGYIFDMMASAIVKQDAATSSAPEFMADRVVFRHPRFSRLGRSARFDPIFIVSRSLHGGWRVIPGKNKGEIKWLAGSS